MKLRDLYSAMSTEERQELAKKAGCDPAYLWQLATGWRNKRPSLRLMCRLVAADSRLRLEDLAAEFNTAGEKAHA